MSQTVPVAQATSDEVVLPERVQEALGQLVGAAKEGLLALSVEVGLGVLRELLEEEVYELVGPKGKWNPDRTAVRHGGENGEVTLGGRSCAERTTRRSPCCHDHAVDAAAATDRVGAGLTPAPPTPPDVRVRIRRFAQHSRKRR